MRKFKGNALGQYGLVITLVALALVPIFYLCGQTLYSIFNNYLLAFTDVSNTVSQNSGSILNNYLNFPSKKLPPTNSPITSTVNIAGYDVNFHQDGSVSFNVGTQSVNLDPQLVNLQNEVVETSGSAGISDLVKEIGYLITQHQGEYPPGQVPVELTYGSSQRTDGATTYNGKAGLPSSTIVRVGTHMVILQKDQASQYNLVGPSAAMEFDPVRIEGNLDISGQLAGSMSCNGSTPEPVLFDTTYNNGSFSMLANATVNNNARLAGSSTPITPAIPITTTFGPSVGPVPFTSGATVLPASSIGSTLPLGTPITFSLPPPTITQVSAGNAIINMSDPTSTSTTYPVSYSLADKPGVTGNWLLNFDTTTDSYKL